MQNRISIITTEYMRQFILVFIGCACLCRINAQVISLDPVGIAPNASGATINGSILTMQPASSSQPGLMTALAQSFGGNKTFTNNLYAGAGAFGGSALTPGYLLDVYGYIKAGNTNPIQIGEGIIQPYTGADAQNLHINATRINIGEYNGYTRIPNPALLNVRSGGDGTEIFRFSTNPNGPYGYVSMTQMNSFLFRMNFVQGSSSQLYLSENSNIGINTTAPTEKLDILGNLKSTGIRTTGNMYVGNMSTNYPGFNSLIAGGTGTGGLIDFVHNGSRTGELYTSANAFNIYADAGKRINIYTNNNVTTPVITANDAGNVGIGLVSPDANAKLDVQGNIFSSGKIAIGTKDPLKMQNYSLAVNGNAIFNKVKVQLYGGWADYVFEEGYELPTLTATEKFIRLHKHLPGIPSAKEIAENGIDVGESQTILLKKVEELTLYIIEMDKKVQKLILENKEIRESLKNNKMHVITTIK